MANLALSHLGVGAEIANLDTEKSQEAKAIRAYYDLALKKVFSEHDWSFARRYLKLALLEECPNDEFGYAYRVPSSVLQVKKVLSGVRNETRQSRVTYHIGGDDVGRVLYTDLDQAKIKATVLVEDINTWPGSFQMMFSYYLAFLIAPRISKQDPFKMRDTMYQLYKIEKGMAASQDANENQYDEEPKSEFERVRYGHSYSEKLNGR